MQLSRDNNNKKLNRRIVAGMSATIAVTGLGIASYFLFKPQGEREINEPNTDETSSGGEALVGIGIILVLVVLGTIMFGVYYYISTRRNVVIDKLKPDFVKDEDQENAAKLYTELKDKLLEPIEVDSSHEEKLFSDENDSESKEEGLIRNKELQAIIPRDKYGESTKNKKLSKEKSRRAQQKWLSTYLKLSKKMKKKHNNVQTVDLQGQELLKTEFGDSLGQELKTGLSERSHGLTGLYGTAVDDYGNTEYHYQLLLVKQFEVEHAKDLDISPSWKVEKRKLFLKEYDQHRESMSGILSETEAKKLDEAKERLEHPSINEIWEDFKNVLAELDILESKTTKDTAGHSQLHGHYFLKSILSRLWANYKTEWEQNEKDFNDVARHYLTKRYWILKPNDKPTLNFDEDIEEIAFFAKTTGNEFAKNFSKAKSEEELVNFTRKAVGTLSSHELNEEEEQKLIELNKALEFILKKDIRNRVDIYKDKFSQMNKTPFTKDIVNSDTVAEMRRKLKKEIERVETIEDKKDIDILRKVNFILTGKVLKIDRSEKTLQKFRQLFKGMEGPFVEKIRKIEKLDQLGDLFENELSEINKLVLKLSNSQNAKKQAELKERSAIYDEAAEKMVKHQLAMQGK